MRFLAICVIAVLATMTVKAQFSVGADIVSNYVWRGVQQGTTNINIQPSLSYSVGNFTIGTWGSYGILGTVKEVDLFATYKISDMFSITATDYNWNLKDTTTTYFDYSKHILEGTISYTGIEAFPMTVTLSTMFYGDDKKNDKTQAYSTYLELGYPIIKNVNVFLGASLNESTNYKTAGFAITNVGVKGSKSLEFTDKFSLPVYGILGVNLNPNAKDVFLVVGLTL